MNPTTHHFFNTPLGDVHFIDAGEPDAAPVVLLHQTPRSVDEFAEVIPILATQLRVIAVDNPGYGASDIPPRQPTVEEYADTVVALLDHLEIPQATLVGHHTGAILAVDVAARYPDRVDRLVLSGPHYMDAEMRELLHKISVQWRVQPDGSHMTEKWEKFSGWVSDPAIVHRVVTDLLRAGETSEYGHFACAEYLMEEHPAHGQGTGPAHRGTQRPLRQPPEERGLRRHDPSRPKRWSWKGASSCPPNHRTHLPRRCWSTSSLPDSAPREWLGPEPNPELEFKIANCLAPRRER